MFFETLVDWSMADRGRAFIVLGLLLFALLILLLIAAVLAWLVSEAMPWAPTAVNPETRPPEWPMPEWETTKPMPLYGSQGPFTGQEPMPPAALTELANGSTVQESSRQRPRWLG